MSTSIVDPVEDAEDPRTGRGRRYAKCPCGVCGADTAVNFDGTLRRHGPTNARCDGSGMSVHAHTYQMREDGRIIVYGTCGVCGVGDLVSNPQTFMRIHNHARPQVIRDGTTGLYTITWFRYRTFQWRRRYVETHEEAMNVAQNIRERIS